MFRKMRRKKQELSDDESILILEKNTSGILALKGEEDYPYAVPLSYVFVDGALYFHSAKDGHKIDLVKKNSNVSFCVVDQDQIIPEEYTTYFRSVIVFGKIELMKNKDEIIDVLHKLGQKYYENSTKEDRDRVINGSMDNVCMMKLSIDHMSGKEAIELVRAKEKITNE